MQKLTILNIAMLKRTLSSIGFWFVLLTILQTNNSILYSQAPSYISGRILDSNSNEPVPFATVWLQKNLLGVIANFEADFRVPNNPAFKSDSLVISCIGYERTVLPFGDFIGKELKTIYLKPAIYDLKEVQVVRLIEEPDSRKIILRALRRLPRNHPKKDFSFVSYYRDYQKRNGDYINLNEAIIQTLDNGIRSLSETNKYRMFEYETNEDFQRIPMSPYYDSQDYPNFDNPNKIIPRAQLGDHYGNELFVLLVHDAIRNYRTNSFSFIDTLSKDFLRNHIFSEPKPILNNELMLYKIDFTNSSRIELDTLYVTGSVYIQPKDYSIHKLDYSCGYLTDKGNKSLYSINTEYGYEDSLDSLMCLKYISFNNAFKIVDTTDTDYFQILDSYWQQEDISKPTMVFKFNRPIALEPALRKQNYQINSIENPPSIKEIHVVDDSLYLTLKKISDPEILNQLEIDMFNITDIYGNNLNQRKLLEFFQYRELFVQDYNLDIKLQDSCYLEPMPLDQNCISKTVSSSKYWMNTPIGLSEDK